MSSISHPLIRPDSIESREYQLAVAMKALDGNTMVILPTGLGKTAVALIVAASRLYNEKGRVLMLAPTNLSWSSTSASSRSSCSPQARPGPMPPRLRCSPVKPRRTSGPPTGNARRLIFATPQVGKNDLIAGRYTLKDVTLMIVDECHRAVGNYAYVFLAQRYMATADKPLILAMTASPGGAQVKVQEVCTNLGITQVENRTENDPDVRPYVHEREIDIVSLALPVELKSAIHANQLPAGEPSRAPCIGRVCRSET